MTIHPISNQFLEAKIIELTVRTLRIDYYKILSADDQKFTGKKGKDDKPWFDGRDIRHIHCVRSGRCEKLKNSTCFGSKLPYQFTSLDLTDSLNQDESRERLYNYEALRYIPKCWAVIQVH